MNAEFQLERTVTCYISVMAAEDAAEGEGEGRGEGGEEEDGDHVKEICSKTCFVASTASKYLELQTVM